MAKYMCKFPKVALTGPQMELNETYGGLGAHYLETLYKNMNKINQIDTVTGVTETNGSVRARSIQLAKELKNQGVVDNDIILICSRCHADQTVVVLGTLLVGAIVAPMDPELSHKDCLDIVKMLKPKMCFCDLRALKQIERVVQETGMVSKMVHFGDQQSCATAFQRLVSYKSHFLFEPTTVENPKKRVAFILHTSGTTDVPKLVCISHQFIYSQTAIYEELLKNPDKIISYYSLAWITQVVLMCLAFSKPIVRILTGGFDERSACKLIHELRVDHIFLSTDMVLRLVDHVGVRDFNMSCLKCAVIGSLTTTVQDIKHLIGRLPKVRFVQMYTTTETGTLTGCTAGNYEESIERIGTAGKIMHNFKARVVDIDTRMDVGPECLGELLVKGDNIMLGYFKNLNATKAAMHDEEYFKTGDLAKYDCEGWVYVEGRVADLIKIDGVRTSPRDIEEMIMMHPYVKDAAVIGNDKEIIACVVLKPDARLDIDKLNKFMSDKLDPSRVPKKIIFMDVFPATTVGKVKKEVLREQLLKVKIERSESMQHNMMMLESRSRPARKFQSISH